MRQLAGCRACGHVEMASGGCEEFKESWPCQVCGEPLRAIGLLGARQLAELRRYPWDSSSPQSAGSRHPTGRPAV